MKKFSLIVLILISVFVLVLTVACNVKNTPDNTAVNNRLKVYTSFYPMYDFAKKIGGDKIELVNLVPSGTEPHDWEPTPGDIASLEKANIFIYSGAGMEGWVDKVLGSINNKNLLVVEASKGLSLIKNADENEELEYDPHVWLNPILAKQQMEAIKNALVTADSANKDFYENNFKENAKKIDDLDKEYRDTISTFARKDIVVAHEAFGYLANAYGLKQVAIEGLSAEAEPTPARMAEVAEFARKNNVKYIFFEELVNPKVAQAIANEVGAKTEKLNPLEGLSQEETSAGKEYFSVMKDNLQTLSKALK